MAFTKRINDSASSHSLNTGVGVNHSASIVAEEMQRINSSVPLKATLVVALFVITFFFALLPVWIKRRQASGASSAPSAKHNGRVFSWLVCFGGGVFLATCMLDLLPEATGLVREALDEYYPGRRLFPLGECLVCVGFFTVLVIEQVMHWALERRRNPEHRRLMKATSTSASMAPESPTTPSTDGGTDKTLEKTTFGLSPQDVDAHNHHDHDHDAAAHEEDEMRELALELEATTSTINAIVLIITLSLHSCFEGLPLGLQGTRVKVWQLFMALVLHKAVEGFSLGVNVTRSRLDLRTTVVAACVYAAMTPAGAVMGMTVSRLFDDLLLTGVLNCLATGTFLFVTTFEIMPQELKRHDGGRLTRIAAVLVGFALMTMLVAFL